MKSSRLVLISTLIGLGCLLPSQAALVTLNSLDQTITVGLNDNDKTVAPIAPGDGWFSGAHEGTLRGRQTGDIEERRTQWYFVFDISAMAGVDAGDITGVTLSIPQIGRLNTVDEPGEFIHLYDPNFVWDTDGSNYPVWNAGRNAPNQAPGYPGGTHLTMLGTYNQNGLLKDVTNPNVEGNFTLDNAALLTTVQSWATNPASNEGFLMTYQSAKSIGLAFGTPTLEITTVVIPEPATLALLLPGLFLASFLCRRK